MSHQHQEVSLVALWLKTWAGITRPSVRKARYIFWDFCLGQYDNQAFRLCKGIQLIAINWIIFWGGAFTFICWTPFFELTRLVPLEEMCRSSRGTINTGHECFGVFPLAWCDTNKKPYSEKRYSVPPSFERFQDPTIYLQQEKDPETPNFHRCSDHAPWIPPRRGVPPPRPTRRRPALERGDPHHCRCHRSWRWPICPSSCDPPSPSELQELGESRWKGWISWGEGIHRNQDDYGFQFVGIFQWLPPSFPVRWCLMVPHYPAQSMSCLLLTYGHIYGPTRPHLWVNLIQRHPVTPDPKTINCTVVC